MQVVRVAMPGSGLESFTVLGEDDRPVEPIEVFLGFLSTIERSPNTVKAYAHDLKDWFAFLGQRRLDWCEVELEDVGEFVAWLRLPAAGRSGAVAVLPSVAPALTASSINRKLAALGAFYRHHARHGVAVAEALVVTRIGARGSFRPFLHHISKGKPRQGRAITLASSKKLPRVLSVAETQAILDGCDHLRDRLMFAVLHETGMRIGEVLGLRHADIAEAEREIAVVARDNANRARTKSPAGRTIPVSASLVRLYADYLHHEYGDLDSDYVFVNLFAQPRGRALTYPAVHELVVRLRKKTGIDFDPHWLRHSAATRMLREKVPIEIVSKLLGHASTTTTLQIYGHLTVEDARRALDDAGWFEGTGVRV